METNQNPGSDEQPVVEAAQSEEKHHHNQHEHVQSHQLTKKFGRSLPRPSVLLGTVIVVAVLIGFITWCFAQQHQSSKAFNENANVNTNEYQALFLTNGQVYFGKISNLNHRYVTISDIYYLQVQQNLQDGSKSSSAASQVSLAKLGSELHGPEDKMYIASDQVLFWENLKSDSKVVQAITKYQNQ